LFGGNRHQHQASGRTVLPEAWLLSGIRRVRQTPAGCCCCCCCCCCCRSAEAFWWTGGGALGDSRWAIRCADSSRRPIAAASLLNRARNRAEYSERHRRVGPGSQRRTSEWGFDGFRQGYSVGRSAIRREMTRPAYLGAFPGSRKKPPWQFTQAAPRGTAPARR